MNEITIKNKTSLFESKIIGINKYSVEIKTNNGNVKQSQTIIETKFDAVSVILYDPKTKDLIFIKQFRVGPLLNKESNFLLEFAGGMAEKNLTLEENAIKEVKEEVGADVKNIEYVTDYYAFLPVLSFKFFLFFAEIDSSQLKASAGLIEEEGEYTEIEKIKADDVYQMLKRNEISNSQVIVGLEWFFREKHKK